MKRRLEAFIEFISRTTQKLETLVVDEAHIETILNQYDIQLAMIMIVVISTTPTIFVLVPLSFYFRKSKEHGLYVSCSSICAGSIIILLQKYSKNGDYVFQDSLDMNILNFDKAIF